MIRSFLPIVDARATRLVLGSMPGAASLAEGQYYAHPQNAFWRIMGELLGFAPDAPYADRVRALLLARIAVWDVLQFCERPGSLDSAIRRDTEVANDFTAFFARYPLITEVCFNGGAAQSSFARRVAVAGAGSNQSFVRLPSTSPAFAAMRYEQKRGVWHQWLLRSADA